MIAAGARPERFAYPGQPAPDPHGNLSVAARSVLPQACFPMRCSCAATHAGSRRAERPANPWSAHLCLLTRPFLTLACPPR